MAGSSHSETPSLCYIYGLDLTSREANVHQTLCMLNALADHAQVTFITNWVKASELNKTFDYFNIRPRFRILRFPIPLTTRWLFAERVCRFAYCLMAYSYVLTQPKAAILTRDFAFIYFLSLINPGLRHKRKIIYEQHKTYHLTTEKTSYRNELKALNAAGAIISISPTVSEDLVSLFGIESSRIILLKSGVDLEFFQGKTEKLAPQVNELLRKTEGQNLIIYSGSFLPWKGVETLLEAMNELLHARVHLVIVGGDSVARQNLHSLIQESPSRENITLMQQLPQIELRGLLQRSDVAIIPHNDQEKISTYSSPLKLFEYLAVGLPIVASEVIRRQQVVSEPENCIFFRTGDHKDLALKINYLLENPASRVEMGRNNREAAVQFAYSNRSLAIMNFFNKIQPGE